MPPDLAVPALSWRGAAGALATLDAEGRFTALNAQAERLLARSAPGLLGQGVWGLFHKTARRQVQAQVRAALVQGCCLDLEAPEARPSRWLALRGERFAEGLALRMHDVTARRQSQAQLRLLRYLAFYDALTGLPNRHLLLERLKATLARPGGGQGGALMFIDLDRFKVLNDTLGHQTGDELLRQVAARLRTCVLPEDPVARLGGDEFVVLLQPLAPQGADGETVDRVTAVAHQTLRTLAEPYPLPGGLHHGSCSIGVTVFGAQPVTVSELLKQADQAMYRAKRAGRNTVCFFHRPHDPLAL
jgi:diguanylate cyclase (GGDEF)-like protein